MALGEGGCGCRAEARREGGKAVPRLPIAKGELRLYPSVDELNISLAWVA